MRCYSIDRATGIDALKIEAREVPAPGPGQLLVRMRAVSLNYRDLLVACGNYSRSLPTPLIPMSDGAGEIVETGDGVTLWKKGDRVATTFFQDWDGGEIWDGAARSALGGARDGVLSEYVVLRERGVVALPAHLTFEEGATLPCAALTAWHALQSGGIACGRSVLTMGSGGVSVFALQFAVASGARVIATTGSDAKAGRLLALGASDVLNYQSEPNWESKVFELTGRRGVDQVVEVGGAGTLGKSLRAVRTGGHVSLIGVLAGGAGEVNPLPAVMKGVTIRGIFVGSREMFEEMNRAIALHAIRPVVDRVFAFEEAPEAYRYLQSGAHFGKVVIAI
jgi:NADPH:quinone reductase-like Zn-dependent oxidoreductase